MNVFVLITELAEGLARGFVLFLTGRHNYVEQISTPRVGGHRHR